ncbi:DUF2799 domain-containing protein [Vibrio breoganii]
MRLLLTAVFTSLLTACAATPSNSSWQEIGYKQGAKGLPMQTTANLEQRFDLDMVKKGEYTEYLAGFEQGKQKFCNPVQAYEYGTWGNRYKGQCSGLPEEALIAEQMKLGYERYIFSDSEGYYP